MSDLNDRIARFENMTAADADNDMAHFSLGQAYMQAGRAAEAAQRFERCIELNPEMSKAYQLAGEAMIEAGWADKAVEIMNRGYVIAASKGERLPMNGIEELLQSIGREPPKLSEAAKKDAAQLEQRGAFICQRTGRPGSKLQEPPMRGPVGEWIQQNISAETWRDWIAQGTKVINELRLDFSKEEDQATYDQYMREFLGIDESAITQ